VRDLVLYHFDQFFSYINEAAIFSFERCYSGDAYMRD
jgi:hypothetical protein